MVYGDVRATFAPFIVPYGGTVQVPAVLTGSGTACTAIYYLDYGCSWAPGDPTYPVVVANVDLDIDGYLTFAFQPLAFQQLSFTATFTPIPEPCSALLLLTALAIIAVWGCRKSLLRAIEKA